MIWDLILCNRQDQSKWNEMRNSKVVWNILNVALSILLAVLLAFVLLKAGEVAYDLGYRVFTEPALEETPGQDMSVVLTEGMSALELGSLLEEKRLVDSGLLFAIQLELSEYHDKIKAGKYTLNTSKNAQELMQILAGEEAEEKEE